MTTRLCAAALALAALVASCGIDQPWSGDAGPACGSLSCSNRLTIVAERRDSAPFAEGRYTFAIEAAGVELGSRDCLLALGRLDCGTPVGALGVALEEDGLAISLELAEAPESVLVAVDYEDQRLAEEQLAPQYALVSPNGQGCAPTCLQARETLAVASP